MFLGGDSLHLLPGPTALHLIVCHTLQLTPPGLHLPATACRGGPLCTLIPCLLLGLPVSAWEDYHCVHLLQAHWDCHLDCMRTASVGGSCLPVLHYCSACLPGTWDCTACHLQEAASLPASCTGTWTHACRSGLYLYHSSPPHHLHITCRTAFIFACYILYRGSLAFNASFLPLPVTSSSTPACRRRTALASSAISYALPPAWRTSYMLHCHTHIRL